MGGWGQSLWLDAKGCDGNKIRSSTNIKAFVKELVEEIDMIAYGDPSIIHFGTEDKQGYTLVQLIETSNITAHFSEETNCAYFDVFSCKDFNPTNVIWCIERYFAGPKFSIKWGIVPRGNFNPEF